MSFSSEAKVELCRLPINRICCAAAEAYGALLYCNTFSAKEIKIVTENRAFASRLIKLFNRAFEIEFDQIQGMEVLDGKAVLSITSKDKLTVIFSAYGYDADKIVAHHINLGVLEEEHCRIAFLRGAFLSGGSVTAPEKRYHLELVTDHFNVNGEVYSILLEMGLSSRDTSRGGNYIIYFKSSEAIEDFLTMIGAPVSAMSIMSAKIEKELRNSVNRRVNCDAANVDKIVDAAQEQIDAINKLGLESLPEKLRTVAEARLQHPEASLRELAGLVQPPVTKSCLNHRLRKLVSMAENN